MAVVEVVLGGGTEMRFVIMYDRCDVARIQGLDTAISIFHFYGGELFTKRFYDRYT